MKNIVLYKQSGNKIIIVKKEEYYEDIFTADFDQLFIIKKIDFKNKTIELDLYNHNRSKAYQCVNGSLCMAAYVDELYGLNEDWFLCIGDTTNIINKEKNNYLVKVDQPIFYKYDKNLWSYKYLDIDKKSIQDFFFSMCYLGNYHIIVKFFKDPYLIDQKKITKMKDSFIEDFKIEENINFSLAYYKNDKKIILRTIEYGVGETASCGSAIIAASFIGRKFFNLDTFLKVTTAFNENFIKINKKTIEFFGIPIKDKLNLF